MHPRKDDSPNSQATILEKLQTNLKLALTKGLMVFPTQPIQVIIRAQQKDLHSQNPQFISGFNAARDIYRYEKSFYPLFKGAKEGALKEFGKNLIYKAALITGAPGIADYFFASTLSPLTTPSQYHIARSLLAGTIAGIADTAFGGVFEGWATFRATSQGVHAKASFWSEVAAEKTYYDKFKRMYKGGLAATLKGSVAFSTYFGLNGQIKNAVIAYYNVKKFDDLPWHGNLSAAVLSGSSVAITSAPFDLAKTLYQMPNSSNQPIHKIFFDNYQKYGLKSLTPGIWWKIFMVVAGWGVNDLVTQPLCHSKHKNDKDETPTAINVSSFSLFSKPKPVPVEEKEIEKNKSYRPGPSRSTSE